MALAGGGAALLPWLMELLAWVVVSVFSP